MKEREKVNKSDKIGRFVGDIKEREGISYYIAIILFLFSPKERKYDFVFN